MKIPGAIALLAVCCGMAMADDRTDYNRRAAEADQASFRTLDRDGDGRLTRDEVRSDVNFAPRFDSIDINRDGIVTAEEMRRYLEQTYGIPATEITVSKQ